MLDENETNKEKNEVTLRPASGDDEDLLRQIYASTRVDEVSQFGWTEEQAAEFLSMQFAAQRAAYRMQFPDALDQVILSDGNPAGRLLIEQKDTVTFIRDIAVLPEFRGRGIGTAVIKMLQAAAGRIVLHVERGNAAAARLYEQLGFVPLGSSATHIRMEWTERDNRVQLRAAGDDDREFLIGVYEASREIELAMTPWDAAQRRVFAQHQFDAQTLHYESNYPNTEHSLILFEGEAAGRLFVFRGDEQLAILDITVMPAFRERGIGSELIRRLQAEALTEGHSLRIFIEAFNPSQEFFRKRGFREVSSDGINIRFEWHAK